MNATTPAPAASAAPNGQSAVPAVPVVAASPPSAPAPAPAPAPIDPVDAVRKWLAQIPPDQRTMLIAAVDELRTADDGAPALAPAPAPTQAPATTHPIPTRSILDSAPTPTEVRAPAPALPGPALPGNFLDVPEAVFRWTPEACGGHPLCGLLVSGKDHEVDKREKQAKVIPGRLIFFLMAPAWALTRDGKRVLLSAGRYVVVHLYDGLSGLVSVANTIAGMVNMFILPTGATPAEHGNVLHNFRLAWEEARDKPGSPKLYARDILRAAQQQQAAAGGTEGGGA